jgi:hypothetical protein
MWIVSSLSGEWRLQRAHRSVCQQNDRKPQGQPKHIRVGLGKRTRVGVAGGEFLGAKFRLKSHGFDFRFDTYEPLEVVTRSFRASISLEQPIVMTGLLLEIEFERVHQELR